MKALVTLRAAFSDPHLLGGVMGGDSREPMRALLLASQGETLTDSERAHFQRLTGREYEPTERVEELHVIASRRAGKSSALGAMAVYLSALCDYKDCLSPGERGIVLILAENQRQARTLFDYVEGAFEASAALRKLIVGRTQSTLSLSNRIDVEVRAADFRSIRGLTLVACLCEEISMWRSDESANPDSEIIAAAAPGLLTTQGQLFSIGSPYARRGFAYTAYKEHWGPEGDEKILVALGSTRDFNCTVSQDWIDRKVKRDPSKGQSEYLGQFRQDIEAFVSPEIVDAAISRGVFERPPIEGAIYHGFIDPSGGGADEMSMAIGHLEGGVVIIDAMRGCIVHSPDAVVDEYVALLKSYGVYKVVGDRWGAEFVREQFKKRGVDYLKADRAKSDFYKEFLPLLNSGRVDLLDNQKLVTQLCSLERRVARGGRDSIDHPDKGHDDWINSVAGVAVLAAREAPPLAFHVPTVTSVPTSAYVGAVFFDPAGGSCSPPGGWSRSSPEGKALTGGAGSVHWSPGQGTAPGQG